MNQPNKLTPKQRSIKAIETYMKSYEHFFEDILRSVNKINIDYQINHNSINYYSSPNDKLAFSNHFNGDNFKLITHNDIHGGSIDLNKYKYADITININKLYNALTGNNDNKECDEHFYIFSINKNQMCYKEAKQIIPDNYGAFNELRFELNDVHKMKVCKFETDKYFIFIIFNDSSVDNNGNFIFKDHNKVEEIKKDDFNYNNVISADINSFDITKYKFINTCEITRLEDKFKEIINTKNVNVELNETNIKNIIPYLEKNVGFLNTSIEEINVYISKVNKLIYDLK